MTKRFLLSTAIISLCLGLFAQEYTLVWNEDFTDVDANGLPVLDRNVWNVEVNGDGGGNNELQYYCEEGVSIEREPWTGKYCMVLTATRQESHGKHCTSGRVNTKNNTYYTFGKIESRIKFPNTANGLWPAFWQMGNDFDQVGWPRCGETDIIELGHQNAIRNNQQDRYFNGALHLGSAWNTVWSDAQSITYSYSVEDTFHIISMEWTPTSIDMYIDKPTHPNAAPYFHANLEANADGNAYYDRQIVFGKPNFIIYDLAVGGNFPGIYNINQITALANGPQKMYIDWVRVYQRGDANQSAHFSSSSDDMEEMDPDFTDLEYQGNNQQAAKYLQDGKLVIFRDGETFDILGRRL